MRRLDARGRSMGRALGATLVALVCTATPTTQTFRYGPIQIAPYGVDERDYVYGIPSPKVDGYLTGGTARLVDAQGRPVSLARVMLHHVVFSNAGARLGDKTNPTCDKVTLFDSLAKVPGLSEPVAGFAEEHVNEHLPPGYGYPIKATDHWVGTWMLMNHRDRPETVYLEYTADVVTGESLKPAYPVWLDVLGLDHGSGAVHRTDRRRARPPPWRRQDRRADRARVRRPRGAALDSDVGRASLAALSRASGAARAQPGRHEHAHLRAGLPRPGRRAAQAHRQLRRP